MRLILSGLIALCLVACTCKKGPVTQQDSAQVTEAKPSNAESKKPTKGDDHAGHNHEGHDHDGHDHPAQPTEQASEPMLKTSSGLALSDKNAQVAYMIGGTIGGNFKKDQLDLDLSIVMEGIADGVNGTLTLNELQMNQIMQEFQRDMQAKMRQRMEQEAKANSDAAVTFLETNKTKEGVKTTESGLQYKVTKAGNGKTHPLPTDQVRVHYSGRLIDGTEFDSSLNRGEPSTFVVNQVIKGWTEGLQLMVAGDTFEFYIPPQLAYGERAQGKIPGNSLLIFEVSLLEIVPSK